MQKIELSDVLTERAFGVLAKREAVNDAMKALIEQVAANNIEAMKLWRDVEVEAKEKGIDKAKDEVFSFNIEKGIFFITKAKQG